MGPHGSLLQSVWYKLVNIDGTRHATNWCTLPKLGHPGVNRCTGSYRYRRASREVWVRPADENGVPSLSHGNGGLATAKYSVCGRWCCWHKNGLRPEAAAEGASHERAAARQSLEGGRRPSHAHSITSSDRIRTHSCAVKLN